MLGMTVLAILAATPKGTRSVWKVGGGFVWEQIGSRCIGAESQDSVIRILEMLRPVPMAGLWKKHCGEAAQTNG